MAVSTSSLIGANFSATGTTQLFALGSRANGTDGSVWEYVQASGTFTTGWLVALTPTGTANSFITANAILTAQGVDIGFAQTTISRDEYGWVAKQGRSMYILCTGTCTGGGAVGISAGGGRVENVGVVAVGHTLFGIYITTSASTGTASVGVATLTWPRVVTTAGG